MLAKSKCFYTNGVFYRVLGRGRQPCIMLHGFGLSSTMWLPYLLKHLRDYTFYLPDIRGFGESSHASLQKEQVLSSFADDIKNIIDTHLLQNVVLVGFSMGAGVCLNYLQKFNACGIKEYIHMEYPLKLLNDATWQYGFLDKNVYAAKEALRQVPEEYYQLSYEQVPQEIKEPVLDFISFLAASSFQQRGLKQFVRGGVQYFGRFGKVFPNWASTIKCLHSLVHDHYDFRDGFHRELPISVMVAQRSEFFPAEGADLFAQHSDNCRIFRFDKSGHGFMLQEPIKFAKTLSHLLRNAKSIS